MVAVVASDISRHERDPKVRFGLIVKGLLQEYDLKQKEVYTLLGEHRKDTFSLLLRGQRAPAFADIPLLVEAMHIAGVSFSHESLRLLILAAYERGKLQKTHKDKQTREEWERLITTLSPKLGLCEVPRAERRFSLASHLLETRHLLPREPWRQILYEAVSQGEGKKIVVLPGAAGVGKSSELSWIALQCSRISSLDVLMHNSRSLEGQETGKDLLRKFLMMILSEMGSQLSTEVRLSLDQLLQILLSVLQQRTRRLLVILDHAEAMMDQEGHLLPCWEQFFSHWLRGRHQATLLLATRHWPGWYGGEERYLRELAPLPPLEKKDAVTVLQQLGLRAVPLEMLEQLAERTAGIPLALEWVAASVQKPLPSNEWDEIFPSEETALSPTSLRQAVERLLTEAQLFSAAKAQEMQPMLARLLEHHHLSVEATQLLNTLSLAAVPLGQPALMALCPTGPRIIKELRRASLLIPYEQRLHAHALVASALLQTMTPEQRLHAEQQVILAYQSWLATGQCGQREAGELVADMARVLLKHHRLLEAAQLLIRYGWLAFQLGCTRSLALSALEMLDKDTSEKTDEDHAGALLLRNFLSPFLGRQVNALQKVEDYQWLFSATTTRHIPLHSPIFVSVTHNLMLHAMNTLQFHQAEQTLNTCCTFLEKKSEENRDLKASLVEKRAWLLSVWCEYAHEQGDCQKERQMRSQAIALYQDCRAILSSLEHPTELEQTFLFKRLARVLNYLGYHLGKMKQYREAIEALEASKDLQEREYAEIDGLAPVYGDLSQTFLLMGRYQDALFYDEKAYAETERLAQAGFSFSQEELSIYQVNRGVLFLRLGRIEEAEALLTQAAPRIHERRRMYSMIIQETLDEINQWKALAPGPKFQLDWRWLSEYRRLASYDSYAWLTPAGLFTEEEQRRWNELFPARADEEIQARLGALLTASRERELQIALDQGRQPRFFYPAIDYEDVRQRISGLSSLQEQIDEQEPHALVRTLYTGAIREEIDYLTLILATYLGDTERYRECNLRLNPLPTKEEMDYALSRVTRLVVQGRLLAERGDWLDAERRSALAQAATHLQQFLQDELHLLLHDTFTDQETRELLAEPPLSLLPRRMVSSLTAKHFFETVLEQSGYSTWRVVIDRQSAYPHVEQGLQVLYLPQSELSLAQIKDYLSHELAVHVARCMAGEQSLIGLLGIHTEHSLETEEGLGTYHEIQLAEATHQPHDETGIWFGTLATGLAAGVLTKPQSFLSIETLFDKLIALYRLIKRPDQDIQTAYILARKHARARALRTFRGVPNLEHLGVCYSKDAYYLRGWWKILHAIEQFGPQVLDDLAIGVVALEQLPLLQDVGLTTPLRPFKEVLGHPDLDDHILSFEQSTRESSL